MTSSDRLDDDGPASDDGVIRAVFDWSSLSPSIAVVETIAFAMDAEPTAIEPLYDSIDPDALDAIVRSDGTGPAGDYLSAAFTFAGYHVWIGSDGRVVVRPGASRPQAGK